MEYDKNPQLKFSRIEYKYLISFGLAEELKEYLSLRTILDSANLGGKPYVIRSIYFDSPSLTAYKEKLNGDHERIKVRLRSYSDIEEKKVFLELKKKQGGRIYKERLPISYDNYLRLMNGEIEFLLENDNIFLKKIWYLFHYYRLTPKVLNRYERVSFIDKVIDCKISFDSGLASSSPEYFYKQHSFLESATNGVIMEVKFGNLLPDYFIEMVKKYGIRQHSSCKYLLSIQQAYPKYAPQTQLLYN